MKKLNTKQSIGKITFRLKAVFVLTILVLFLFMPLLFAIVEMPWRYVREEYMEYLEHIKFVKRALIAGKKI